MDYKTFLQSDLHMPDGTLIRKGDRVEVHSYVIGWAACLYSIWAADTTFRCLDTSGTYQNMSQVYVNAGATNTLRGIMIGSGTTPPTVLDYAMESKLTTGWTYGAETYTITNGGANNWHFHLSRPLTNGSGGEVSVNEVGIIGYNNSKYFLLERTLHTVPVPNSGVLTITYTVDLTI